MYVGSAFLAHGYRFFCPTNDFYPTVFFVFQTFNLSYSVTLTHGIYLRIFFDTYMIDLTDICFGFVFSTLNLPAIVYWINHISYKYITYAIILFDLSVTAKSVGIMSDLKLQEFLSNVSEPTQLVQYNTSSFLDNCRTADKAVRTISLVLFHGHLVTQLPLNPAAQ